MCRTESASLSAETQPIIMTDVGFIEVDGGGIAFTLRARDHKAPQVVLITERNELNE